MAFSLFRRRHYADPPSESARETPGSFFKSLLILAVAAWVLRSLIVAPFSIPSGSMLPTMKIGDYLFVSKWPYGYSSASFPFEFPPFKGRIFGSLPDRGDVVVFEGPMGQDVVKRVIGLPGRHDCGRRRAGHPQRQGNSARTARRFRDDHFTQ